MERTMAFRNYRFSPELTKRLNALSNTDNWHALVGLSADFGIVALCAWATSRCYYLYPLALMIIGARQRGLATVMHDAAHGRAAKSKVLNTVIGRYLTAFLIFQSFNAYKNSHVHEHHPFLGDAQKDPDFLFYQDAGLYALKDKKAFWLEHVLATILMINAPQYIYYLFKHRFGSLVRDKGEAIGMLALWSGIFGLAAWLDLVETVLLFWIVPYLTAFMVIGRFIEMAEHYPLLGRSQEGLLLTRNRFSHPLEAFFLSVHQENFHLVHHLRPSIPYWNMKKAHALMLEDVEYRRINAGFGGVFLSSNSVKPLIPSLVAGDIELPSITAPLYKNEEAV